jgi:hypothetical protein
MRLCSVLTTTVLTLKALAAHAVESDSHLSFVGLAMWAFLHVKRYNTVWADLDSPRREASGVHYGMQVRHAHSARSFLSNGLY